MRMLCVGVVTMVMGAVVYRKRIRNKRPSRKKKKMVETRRCSEMWELRPHPSVPSHAIRPAMPSSNVPPHHMLPSGAHASWSWILFIYTFLCLAAAVVVLIVSRSVSSAQVASSLSSSLQVTHCSPLLSSPFTKANPAPQPWYKSSTQSRPPAHPSRPSNPAPSYFP